MFTKMFKEVIAITLIYVTSAAPGGIGIHGGAGVHKGVGGYGGGHDVNVPIPFNFAYGVQDSYHGTNFGHTENGDGYNVKGQYYVHLPDGRLQNVNYYTDEWGYHPTITYEGVAQFPSHSGNQGGYH